MASVMEGLSYGAGDALIGLNPVDDSTESVKRILNKFEEFRSEWEIPTQTCVFSSCDHTNGSHSARGHLQGLVFQSIAGSEKGIPHLA